jgi:hypothetical protein
MIGARRRGQNPKAEIRSKPETEIRMTLVFSGVKPVEKRPYLAFGFGLWVENR